MAATSVYHYLKEKMPPHLFAYLTEASANWSLPLFYVDPETDLFECILHPELSEEAEALFLDAACAASELLSGADLSFRDDPAIKRDQHSSGEIAFTFHFEPDEEAVYERFRRLLTENVTSSAGIEAEFQKYAWGYSAHIAVHFASDFDYQRKKDSIEWMLQVAKKQVDNSPFFGNRV